MFGHLWADSDEILGGKQAMVGLRMIQISGMGEQRFKSGKKCRFSSILASVARTHSLAQQTSSLQSLGHFGQYLGSPQGLGHSGRDSGPAARSGRI